jgi:sugar/nucleoside kinase (ribokinase family)
MDKSVHYLFRQIIIYFLAFPDFIVYIIVVANETIKPKEQTMIRRPAPAMTQAAQEAIAKAKAALFGSLSDAEADAIISECNEIAKKEGVPAGFCVTTRSMRKDAGL